ncbi:hypothetical protein ACWD25_60500, partial [Streptomyces sp. NPDC002920]
MPDLVAGPAEPGVSSPDGEGTAPLLGDTPPLTSDPVDLGTGFSPETATGAGAGTEAVKLDPLPAPGTGPGPSPGTGLGPAPAPGPAAVPGPAAGSRGAAAPPVPAAVQRLDVPVNSPHAPPPTHATPAPPPTHATPVPAEADATPVPAEADRAPLLGDAGPIALTDTVVPEAPGPGEMVTASTPMPMRRLDAVDEATLPGTAPEAEVGAGSVTRGAGPVFPLVAQRSLPLFTVPAPSAEAPVDSEPPAVVPVRWEPVGGGASVSGAGGSAGRA